MKHYTSILLLFLLALTACNEDFLETKPDTKLVVPSTLEDLQALIDYYNIHNASLPGMGELSSDDYYILYDRWNALSSAYQKNAYVWAKEIWEGNNSLDWNNRYQQVFYANYVLEGLEEINRAEDPEWWDQLEGSGLFHRAHAFYQLAQLFCPPYDSDSDNDGYGLPLRTTSDLNVHFDRATVEETYQRILADLEQAVRVLPESDSYKTRPVKAAAYALLSRTYLVMQDYDNALAFADSTIAFNYELIDFNALNTSASYPMERYNSEVIFHSQMTRYTPLNSSRLIIDSTLYDSYLNDDIRKEAWFRTVSGNYTFKGSYDGSTQIFNGLAIDECYLTKAECLARNGSLPEALNTLNQLLVTRFREGTFSPVTLTDQQQLLQEILLERRKELLFRGIRWADLRRLNLDPSTAKTLYRYLDGTIYSLEPNSPNYTLPIADDVLQLSNLPQNTRQ
ncbi:RagB/SusD family nutrient uptake outer membrane protein [Mangrovibacterium diazotrophicum]|uniref:SusD-like starch-binding protein associating with outer membrane n=1 Tax=Mangrovibacterium diazotrophicum TaxID=1261403 RepID=A0A419W5V1_9BACT|nr:RagB/SusD family nutrient uptake outer membrane protein [Mangrovibacterium diazotrophicum]RKD90843.1 SusD-like starch-binding protein associating with outer membrane [Mangrovibacterium diazotrophicum]